MFSDKYLTVKFVAAAVLVSLLAIYYAVESESRTITMPKACADTAHYNGYPLTRQMSKIIRVQGDTLIFVEKQHFYTAVLLPGVRKEPIREKERVSLSGTFRDCVLFVERYHRHSNRKAKVVISLGVLLMLAGYTWLNRATWQPWLRRSYWSR